MKLTILGCYSATPRKFNNPTAQLLEIKGRLFLIDCGEGTQVALRKSKSKFARVKHIFISHLHGDHFYGLIGLISTFHLLGRDATLTIYGPTGIRQIIELQLKFSGTKLNFPLEFIELESRESIKIYEDEKLTVSTIPLDHRVYTNGFLFQEKEGERKLNVDAAEEYNIDKSYYRKLKLGYDVINNKGKLIENHLVTFPPEPPKSYAFCSDTKYSPKIIPLIKNVSVLYHESTFLETHKEYCDITKHSTAKQAATIAKNAKVGKLILGHYSTRYESIEFFKEEAQTVFKNTDIADDYKIFEI